MLDFLIDTGEFQGVAPEFLVPPAGSTPVNGATINIAGGTAMTEIIQCGDADVGEVVAISHLGLPAGATLTPNPAIGNPATAIFSWTPIITQAVTVSLTCTDSKGNSALPQAFNIVVAGIPIPAGPDRDSDLFCDNLSINTMIQSGAYNVIDHAFKPSAELTGTAGPDLILAGGLGDRVFGLGGDDCLIWLRW